MLWVALGQVFVNRTMEYRHDKTVANEKWMASALNEIQETYVQRQPEPEPEPRKMDGTQCQIKHR